MLSRSSPVIATPRKGRKWCRMPFVWYVRRMCIRRVPNKGQAKPQSTFDGCFGVKQLRYFRKLKIKKVGVIAQ